jgi:hypothetical protein
MSARSFLDSISIPSPCLAPLDTMPGNDRVRHCVECGQSVYNLSAMSRAEAEAFLAANEGRACVRFYRRKDGSVMTQECPRAIDALRRGSRFLAARLVAFALLLLSLVPLLAFRGTDSSPRGTRLRNVEPIKTVMDWLDPPVRTTAGKLCPPQIGPANPPAAKPQER